MPASETQHTVWRKNLNGNFGAALKALQEGEGEKATLIASMNEAMSRVILAERLAQLSFALDHNSKLVSDLVDRDVHGREVIQRLVNAVQNGDDMEMPIAMAEDWAEGTFHNIAGLEGATLIPEDEVPQFTDEEKKDPFLAPAFKDDKSED